MAADDNLQRQLAAALTPEDRTPPPDRIAALRAAAAARASTTATPAPTPVSPRTTRRSRRMLAVATAAAAIAGAVGFLVGGLIVDDGASRHENLLAGGVEEFEVTLAGPGGDGVATATGIRTGIGRIVQFRTDDLPILPTGERYEVWFVGPDDTPSDPDRISAGTFHPDEQGVSDVDLTAAVDPAKYPVLSVTAEPSDGDPAPTGPEVLRAEITLGGS